MDSSVNLLEIKDLQVYFPLFGRGKRRTADYTRAVDSVSFSINQGSSIGLVGESGSGKTTLGRAIVRLVPVTSGSIKYQGNEISRLSTKGFFPYRKKIQMVFQDPYQSLNLRLTVYDIIAEPLKIHFSNWSKERKHARVTELVEKVGLEAAHLDRYPDQFSGGQRQRIGIARSLAVEPEFIIWDEPVSALDVSVQAQIVNLLQDLKEELGVTYLFIAHDLAIIEHVSDYVLVMTKGKIVEQAPAHEIYADPKHDYTKKLLAAVPKC